VAADPARGAPSENITEAINERFGVSSDALPATPLDRLTMGLLDDLKKQAQEVRQKAEESVETKRENARAVDFALQLSFRYFNELCNQLNILKPPVMVPYRLPELADMPPLPEFRALRMQDFKCDHRTIDVDSKSRFVETYVSFACMSDVNSRIKLDVVRAKRLRDLIWQYSLRHKVEEVRNLAGVVSMEHFTLEHEFPVQFSFEGDHERGMLKFQARNLNEFGVLLYYVDARRIDQQALEELAKQILGQPNRWREYLIKEQVKMVPASEKPIPNYVIHEVPDEPVEPEPKPNLLGQTMRIFTGRK
jgi:hypothetical protein